MPESFKSIEIHSDFLIIGSGLAGLYAALYASKHGTVSILTKSTVRESNSYWAQGGIAAALDPEDSTWFHSEDTIAAGRGLCDKDAVQVLVNEGVERVKDLIALGMEFDTGEAGIEFGLEGGHTKRRILHAGGNSTGREIVRFLISAVKSSPTVTQYESTGVLELISDNGVCTGAVALDNDHKVFVFKSKTTILATGGASALYERTTNPQGSTGEGVALAYLAGAEITDMEFVQFHPTAFYNEGGESFLITEAVRGEGAHLLNFKGKRFLPDYDSKAELAPRDVVSRAINTEMQISGKDYVYLDLKHLDTDFVKKRFSNIYQTCSNFGIDITKDLVPVAPAAHYTIGGVSTGLRGQTNIDGFFACGEVACTGVHGANRLASNSLLECVVFAKRAVEGAVEYLNSASASADSAVDSLDLSELNSRTFDEHKDIFIEQRQRISSILNSYVGIVRTREGLRQGLSQLSSISRVLNGLSGLYKYKLNLILEVSLLITKLSLLREESRGVHMRNDFPNEDPEWNAHIILQKNHEHIIRKV